MKLEIDLVTESYEKLLSDWASVGRTLDLAADAIYRSHCHNDDTEEARQYALHEMEVLKNALNSLHMTWRAAYWEKKRAAQEKKDENPKATFALWDKELAQHGAHFVICKKHMYMVKIPAGYTLQKVSETPATDCKFCEFAAEQQQMKARQRHV